MNRSLVFTSMMTLAVMVGCSDDPTNDDSTGGSGGETTAEGGSAGSTQTVGGGGATGGAGGMEDACSSQPVENFMPTWVPPQPLGQGVCTDAELQALVVPCFGPTANGVACAQARNANRTCSDCFMTDETEATHGAIVDFASSLGFFDRNWPGCWAHADGDLSADGCGAMVAADAQCVRQSCSGCFPVSTTEELADANACRNVARLGPCQAEFQAAQTCKSALSGPIADECPWPAGEFFVGLATRYGKLFCGSGSSN